MTNISFPAYGALSTARTTATPQTGEAKPGQKSEGSAIEQGVSGFRDAVKAAETAAIDTAVNGADPHAMVEALAKAELALSSAVTVRDKVVEAYNELLRMPV